MTKLNLDADRWMATVWYRTDAGVIDVEHTFEELSDLHDLIEAGPDFYAIDRIEIRINPLRSDPDPGHTIEWSLSL